MADIQYLNYGDQQIEQQALMNNLANNVQQYVQTQPWSKKRKELFMSAYQDLMNKGVQGASNSTGQWTINVKGDLDLSTKSKKEQEMYQEAAYFIQQQMAGLPTKANQEEEKTKDLPVFDYSTFNKGFLTQMSNDYFGGNPALKTSIWNEFDKRNTETGLRDRTERARKLISSLEKYAKTLKESDYNFKDSPFGSLEELNNRIAKAKIALTETPTNTDDDLETLSALGINASDWFNNGSGDSFKKGDYEGTYGDYYGRVLPQQEKDKVKAEAEKQKAIRANQYTNLKFYGQGLNGKITNNISTQYLNQLAQQSNLNGDQQSELVGAFKLAARTGQLKDLSREELNKFGRFSTGYNKLGRLKKIDGVNGFYWDTYGKRIVRPYNVSNTPQTNFDEILKQNNPENKQAQIKSQLVKQMNQPIQGSLNLSDLSNFGFDEATGNELWAVINDIGAFVNPEAISGTALALNAARLRDKNREGWSWERILDWGTSALGGLPVIGDAASVVKAGSNLVKLANRSARVGSFIGMAFSAVNMPEAWDSIKKIYDKGITSMTPQDIQNITYGLMGLFAGIKTINAVNARQKPQTVTEHSIEIDGKKVKLPDQATADKVSAEYKAAKNNTEASQKVVKMQEVRDAAKKAGIEVTDASKVTSGSGFLRGNQVSRKLGMGKSPIKSEQVNTGEMTGGSTGGYYMPSWRRSFLNQEQKEIKNPLRKTFDWFLGKTPEVKSAETPKTTETKSTETPKIDRQRMNELKKKFGRSKTESSNPKQEYNQKQQHKSEKEIELFEKSYGTNNSSSKNQFGEGYGSNNNTIKNGELSIDLGNGIKFNFKVNNAAEYKGNPGKVSTLRNQVAKKIKEQLYNENVDRVKVGKLLRNLKRKGWLKQGGTIDKQKIQKYKEFIKK